MSKIFHRRTDKTIEMCVGAEGCSVYSKSGRRYVDAAGSIGICSIGYQDPRVIAAIVGQAGKLAFVHNSLFTSMPAEELAEYLLAHASPRFSRIIFASGGSEAIETACKLARQYFFERGFSKKQIIISRRISYHGATLGALSLSGFRVRQEPYLPVLSSHYLAEPCYPYRLRLPGESEPAYKARALQSIEDMINKVGPERVCAVLIEPIVGAAGGALVPVPGYLSGLREICDRYGVLLIFDEVMCGLGRTGYLHACDVESVVPDMLVVAKGLASGYQPLSAVYVGQDIVQTFFDQGVDFRHGFSFMAHPVACAAALAVQRIVQEDNLVANARDVGEYLSAAIRQRTKDLPVVGDVRGRGLMIGIELVGDPQTKQPLPKVLQIHHMIKELCREEGLLVYPQPSAERGEIGDTVLLLPPLILNQEIAEEIVDKVCTALGKLSAWIDGHASRFPFTADEPAQFVIS